MVLSELWAQGAWEVERETDPKLVSWVTIKTPFLQSFLLRSLLSSSSNPAVLT